MADPVMSELSVRSIEAQSKLSVLSVAATSAISSSISSTTPVAAKTTSVAPKATSTAGSATSPPAKHTAATTTHTTATATTTKTHKTKATGKSSSTTTKSATHSSTPIGAASNAHKGVSGGAIAAIVIVIIVVAAGVAFLFWRRRRQQTSRQRSGLWLESGAGYGGSSGPKGAGDASTKKYMFNGSGHNGVSLEPRPFSLLAPPPPPPPKEKDYTPESPAANAETTLLSPSLPSRAHSPRPRTPELPPTPGKASDSHPQAQNALASGAPQYNPASRPDSGPMVLYSTPRHNDYFGTGSGNPTNQPLGSVTQQPTVLSSDPARAAPTSMFAEQNVSAPPAPIPVPLPAPVPAPAPISSSNGSVAQNLQRTASPSISSVTAASFPAPPAYTPQALAVARSLASSPAPKSPSIVLNNAPNEKLPVPKIYAVIRTYVPTLLDELRISVGDRVFVVNEFDDGWGFCERVGDPDGAAGVVPLECLDRSRNLAAMGDGIDSRLGASHAPSPVNSFASLPSMSASAGTDTHLSARFSSFHVDFDAIGKERI